MSAARHIRKVLELGEIMMEKLETGDTYWLSDDIEQIQAEATGATPLGLHTRAVGWQKITRPELFVLVALEDGRWRRWQTICDVARDLDVDRDAMLAALDAWGVAYSDGSDILHGERQWCRLPGITFDAEGRSAELARATRFVVCALAGRPLSAVPARRGRTKTCG